MTSQAIVYQATNTLNGHRYIGYTARGLAVRKIQHLSVARKGRGNHFHRAINKYGAANFVFEVMADFDGDEDLAKLYEIEAIAKYKPEYNLSYGGEGGTMHESTRKKIAAANSRRVFTDEMRKNLSDSVRGRKHTPETREKMRASQVGRKHTPETIEKMRVVCAHPISDEARAKMRIARQGRESPAKGKKWNSEARQRMSAMRKGRPSPLKGSNITEEHRQKIRAGVLANPPSREKRSKFVKCITDGAVFKSANEADRFYGFPLNSVSKLARNGKTSRGLRFEYVGKNE